MVWTKLDTIKHQFLSPVRTAITTTQHYCRSKLANPNIDSSGKTRHLSSVNEQVIAAETNPEVSVMVEGRQLPDVSPQLETEVCMSDTTYLIMYLSTQILETVLFRLDMMTSVLVRVEELSDSRTVLS